MSSTIRRDNGDGTFSVAVSAPGPKSIEDMMTLGNLRPDQWDVVSFRTKNWDMVIKGGDTQICYWHHLIVRPRLGAVDYEAITRAVKRECPKWDETPKFDSPRPGLALEVGVFDLHLGQYSDLLQSDDTYSSSIACKRLFAACNQLWEGASALGEITQVVFALAGDIFHANDDTQKTKRGTSMANDHEANWRRVQRFGQEMISQAIGWFSTRAPVRVVVKRGNHDETASFHLGRYLQALFHTHPDVEVDDNDLDFSYFAWGKNLIGYTHGDLARLNRKANLAAVMATDVPEMWAQSAYREVHHGHFHVREVWEDNGVIIRQIPSLGAVSPWSYAQGYRSQPGTLGFVYDPERGNIATLQAWFEKGKEA